MNKITRREALKRLYSAVIAIGASHFISFADLLATEDRKSRPKVIWLHGSSCSGCSTSFLDIEDVPVVDLITQFMELVFHPDISAATGDQVGGLIDTLIDSKEPFIFVFEGGIPLGMPHACLMGDRPIAYWVEKLASKAAVVIAAGTCAVFGGVTQMAGTLTGSVSLQKFMESEGVEKPLVNLPNCPMRPEHITYTLLHQIQLGKLPELDNSLRPTLFFKKTVHQGCIYYSSFQEDFFAEFIGDEGCLFKLGCQGPVTYNDCLLIGHNGNTNTCIRAAHPCIGCAGSEFPRKIMYHNFGDPRVLEKKVIDPKRGRTT